MRYTGPIVTGSASSGRDPAVLVSLSTYNFPGRTEAMQNILEALAPLDTRIIVTTGPVIDADDLRVPDNAVVHRYVPHAELMTRVSLVVGHGGQATTMQALAHDLPVAVMPMHPEELRPLLAELLEGGPHRIQAARLGEAIRASRGADTAADRIEGLIGEPVSRQTTATHA